MSFLQGLLDASDIADAKGDRVAIHRCISKGKLLCISEHPLQPFAACIAGSSHQGDTSVHRAQLNMKHFYTQLPLPLPQHCRVHVAHRHTPSLLWI